jgi:alpha-tubulin suppressor-like RCC1 family protein
MTIYDKKSHVLSISGIFVSALAVLIVIAAFLFGITIKDLTEFKPIFHPSIESSKDLAESISLTDGNTLAIKRDGTLYAYDASGYGDDLQDISGVDAVSVAADHMAAVRYDGTVVCMGDNSFGQCESAEFEGIKAVDAECGDGFTVMLSCAGNVYGTGRNDMGQLDFGSLSGVSQISAGKDHVLVLMEDGTVRAYGDNSYMQCEVSEWKDIVQISAGENISAALTGSGMVMTTGGSTDSWSGVVQIAAGKSMIAALTKSGTVKVLGTDVLNVPDVDGWRGMAAVAVHGNRVVGIKSDGTVVAASNGKSYIAEDIKLGAPILSSEEAYYYSRRISAGDGYAFYIEDSDVKATEDAPELGIVGFENANQIRINKIILSGIKPQKTITSLYKDGMDTDIALAGWSGVTYFDMAEEYAVGVTETGSVLYSGTDRHGESAIADIEGVSMVAAAKDHVAALLKDGNVVCVGANDYGECDTESFTDAVWVDTGNYHTAALRGDGRVLACGQNDKGQCDVQDWTDVVTLTVGDTFTVGIKSDGTLVSAGDIDLSTYKGVSALAVDAYGAYCFIWEDGGTVYRAQAR